MCVCLCVVGVSVSAGVPASLPTPPLADRVALLDLNTYRGSFDAAFAVFDLDQDVWYKWEKETCARRFSPCSTFKIFNTMAGLDAGVVTPQTVFAWDGSKLPFASWMHDHDLSSAFKNSVVWYYQKVAQGVGEARMQTFIDQVGYGNRDLSGGIDRFWLGSSLQISVAEQVIFLKRLYRNELPFSVEAMRTVRTLMTDVVDTTSTLSGKTGSHFPDGVWRAGWYVGHLQTRDTRLVFAMHLDGEGASGAKARDMVIRIFRDLDLMPQ